MTGSRAAPHFSVVLPAFNSARTLSGAMRSVLAQTKRGFELIVVDDGSTDATPDVVGEFKDARIRLVSQPNRGLSAARNAGIRAARGSLVAFLDADDLWLPHYLERMGDALDQHQSAGLAYCDAWVFQDGTGRVRRSTVFEHHRRIGPPPSDPAEFLALHLRDNFFYVGTTVRARVFHQVGGFREDMTSMEDYEMWLRIEVDGFPAVEVAEPLALYRVSPNQMSANPTRMATSFLKLCDILEARGDLPPHACAVLARRRRQALAEYASQTAPSLGTVVRHRARGLAGQIWRAMPGRHLWRDRPPAAVVQAFPDLATL